MTSQIHDLEMQIYRLKEELASLRHAAPREEVPNAVFQAPEGPVSLLDLFGDKDDLLFIHNMGRSCSYCTLWADVLNGQLPHLERRAAVVLCSPDPVDVQKDAASQRGWRLRMIQDADKAFTSAMGYYSQEQGWWPGVSGFTRDGGRAYRTGKAMFGPGDDFCPVWPLMDLIGGPKGWEPS